MLMHATVAENLAGPHISHLKTQIVSMIRAETIYKMDTESLFPTSP